MESKFREDSLQYYDTEELFDHINSSILLSPKTHQLSSRYLARQYPSISRLNDAVLAIETARKLRIPVPVVRRICEHKGLAYTIIERISGVRLCDIWAKLNWPTTIDLALQLRTYIGRLRTVTSPVAGSMKTGECSSFWLTDHYGLPDEATSGDINAFLKFWLNFTSVRKAILDAENRINPEPEGHLPSTESPFFLTNHNLSPSSLLVTPTGKLYLLNWDMAGFYPSCFEATSMRYLLNPHHRTPGRSKRGAPRPWSFCARWRWIVFTMIAAGNFEGDYRILKHIKLKTDHFPHSRRAHLLVLDGPTKHPVY
ncbi:Protein kinase-like domain protein [Ascosphaera apis ARSEF 7405]|uniref:Protein kinase-like domain protein n=1 Tax=Ascosphaera apis ARSEF 7405 TaxID=392613 RepID=A0A162IGL8_9EURO|nr:Protein kinase-like domain protein [Ascosphaera apis ARSEF 7405]